MKWLQIILSLWIEVVKVSRSLSFERDRTGIVKRRLYGCCGFDWKNTESSLRAVWSVYIFADGAVSYWSIGRVLSYSLKHNK